MVRAVRAATQVELIITIIVKWTEQRENINNYTNKLPHLYINWLIIFWRFKYAFNYDVGLVFLFSSSCFVFIFVFCILFYEQFKLLINPYFYFEYISRSVTYGIFFLSLFLKRKLLINHDDGFILSLHIYTFYRIIYF